MFSDASGAGSERRRSSSSSRGVYASSNNSRHERQAGSVRFTIEEIYKATNNFSPAAKIGQGGFGTVYKGRLDDGTLVAIKRAKKVVTSRSQHFAISGCITVLDLGFDVTALCG